ncbi:MAG: Ig-like domain-containing protein [Chitinophagales bacterium]
MNLKNWWQILYLCLLTYCLLIACAKQISPNGGPKDETPPKVLEVSPPHLSTNFDSQTIEIEFDEFFKLNKPNEQIIISPLMVKRPEFKIKGRTLTIELQEELQENTTYTINFGLAIQDNNENNELENYEYAFATGNEIDSLEVHGEVLFAKDKVAAENVLVALYETGTDTLFTTTPPKYISRTDKEGAFNLRNIRAGEYQLIALSDKNNNYFFDQATEDIAFHPSPINITDSIRGHFDLFMFNEGKTKLRLSDKKKVDYGHLQLFFSKPQDTLKVRLLDSLNLISADSLLIDYAAKKDTVDIWYRSSEAEELIFEVIGSENYADTIEFKSLKKAEDLPQLSHRTNLGRGELDLNQRLWLQYNHPILQIDSNQIAFFEDSVQANEPLKVWKDTSNMHRIYLDANWKPDQNYQVSLYPTFATDFFGQTRDTIQLNFEVQTEENYGTLIVQLQNFNEDLDYIFQLRDNKNKVIKEQKLTNNQLMLPYLKPSEYQISVIEDRNKDGIWTTGDYELKRQPEKIFMIAEKVEIRPNWENEVVVDLK